MTSVLDTLEKRGLIQRMSHPDHRRKLLVDITPDAQAILDELLPSFHPRERDVISNALSIPEQRQLLRLTAKIQSAAQRAQATPAPHATRHRAARPSRDTTTDM
jgi:DNA-binding MarR family transcriptional regulator